MITYYVKKILALCLVFVLSTFGFPWHSTLAYFSDNETAEENVFALGSLDFSLSSADNFAPIVTPTQPSYRAVSIVNDGSLDFQYRATVDNLGGDSTLCSALNLAVSLEGNLVYNGSLANFALDATTDLGAFTFEINLTDSALVLQNQTCTFDFIFTAWQNDLPDESSGFSDIETLSNTVNSGNWNSVVLNEILPNPEGDDSQAGLQGEWVEIYNNGDQEIDLTGWYIEDASGSGHRQTISAQTTFNGRTSIGAQGSGLEWLVLFMDGAILNNSGDTITLYTPDGQVMDSYSFTASSYDVDSDSNNTPGGNNQSPSGDETAGNEGKSYARIPDGIGPWVDPVPTPGGPNKLPQADSPEESSIAFTDNFILNLPADQPPDNDVGKQIEDEGEQEIDSVNVTDNLINSADNNGVDHNDFDKKSGQGDQTQSEIGVLNDSSGDEENLTTDLSQDEQGEIKKTDKTDNNEASDDINQDTAVQLDEFVEQNSADNGDKAIETADNDNNETTVLPGTQEYNDSIDQTINPIADPVEDTADQQLDNPVETVSNEETNSNLDQSPEPVDEAYYNEQPEESEENIESNLADEKSNLAVKNNEDSQAESGSDDNGGEPATD